MPQSTSSPSTPQPLIPGPKNPFDPKSPSGPKKHVRSARTDVCPRALVSIPYSTSWARLVWKYQCLGVGGVDMDYQRGYYLYYPMGTSRDEREILFVYSFHKAVSKNPLVPKNHGRTDICSGPLVYRLYCPLYMCAVDLQTDYSMQTHWPKMYLSHKAYKAVSWY